MTTSSAATKVQNFKWMISDFVQRTPGVAHGIVVSSDGILVAASEALPDDRADQLAAVTCGIVSLADGAARCFEAGTVTETVIEMQGGTMMLMTIADRSCLALLVAPNADLGQIGYDMALLVDRFGQTLTPGEHPASLDGPAGNLEGQRITPASASALES